MTKVLNNLKPALLWEVFEDICGIPHPSKHEDALRAYVIAFANKHGLESHVDEIGNVILRKAATPGMENKKGIIFQGHLDMVPQKNSSTVHDFLKDPIKPYIDGEWVTAEDTTLGADNGIGVAAAMAIMASDNIKHGPLEALLTVDEEAGMGGAFALKTGLLKGDILINLDSEEEGELYVGCAGGIDTVALFDYKEEAPKTTHEAFELKITGLKGGHSGMDIPLGRANANKLLFRFLYEAHQLDLCLSDVKGGTLRNAIPREAFAVVTVPKDKSQDLQKLVKTYEDIFKNEFGSTEPELSFMLEKCEMPSSVMDAQTQKQVIWGVYGCPNGVMSMSTDMKDLVETSLNLATVTTDSSKKTCEVVCLLRSSVDTAKHDLANMVTAVFELAGAKVTREGEYPGWKPNMDSEILKSAQETYKQMFGKTPGIRAIHAGLECGLLGAVYPHWDMISCGPTIKFPHSPDEKVHIASVEKFWDFLVKLTESV